MTEQQRAELREQARKLAADAPPLTPETGHFLAALLRPAIEAVTAGPAADIATIASPERAA